MALWSMLGARGIDLFAWESFGAAWVSDTIKQLKIEDARVFEAEYGALPDLHSGTQNVMSSSHGTARPPGARSRWRLDSRRPWRIDNLRCHIRGFCDGPAVDQARCGDLVLAEGNGRRSRARHDRVVAASRRAARNLYAALANAQGFPND